MQYNPTGPVWGAINAGTTCFIVGVGGAVWDKHGDFPLWIPFATAAVASLAITYLGHHRGSPLRAVYFRIGCWAFGGTWATFVAVTGMSLISTVVLVLACLCAAMLAPALASMEPPKVEEVPEVPKSDAGIVSEREILRLVVKYGNVPKGEWPTIRKVEDWTPADAGATWRLVGMPGAAFTWASVREVADKIGSALALPVGCPVLAEPVEGGRKNEVDLKISTRNYLADPIDYPRIYTPMSIKDLAAIGRYLDAAPTLVDTHQDSGLVVGKKGSGKTTVMQVITANQLRCPDVLTWHIDLNNGSMAAAFMRDAARGELEHNPLDWVAVDPEEALRMVNAAVRIAEERRASYQSLMMDEDETVLPVAPHLPQINILVDEGGEVTGDDAQTGGSDEEDKYRAHVLQELSKALAKLQRIGRAMCVNVILSYLRGTSDLLPSGMKKQNSMSICGMVYDESEIGYVLGWKKGLNYEDLVQKGQFFIRRDGPVKMFKAFRLKPQQIREIVHATQPIRAMCTLDEASRQAAGVDYEVRWRSPLTVAWLQRLRGQKATVPAGAPVGSAPASDFRAGFTMNAIDAAVAAVEGLTKPAAPKPAVSEPVAGAAPAEPAVPAAEPTAPAAYMPKPGDVEYHLDEFRNELDKWGTIPDDARNTTRPQSAQSPEQSEPEPSEGAAETPGRPKRSPAARQSFIVDLLQAAGNNGLRTGEIMAQVQNARLAQSRDTINTDLRTLEKAGTITQIHPEISSGHGTWWLASAIS